MRLATILLVSFLFLGSVARAGTNLMEFDNQTHEIRIQPGEWRLFSDLIIPADYKVICPPGVSFVLFNSSKIISYSPIEFNGTEADPIVIESGDTTGQGLLVLNAVRRSTLRYVVFRELAQPSLSGWELTGAITFYESPVDISYCTFERVRSDRAVNIVRTSFTISHTLFKDMSSDALGLDFARGEIWESLFVGSGGNAVKVSGSGVELRNIAIENTGGKGLSASQNCQIYVEDLRLRNASVALEGKELSRIVVRGLLNMSGIKMPYLIEEGSSLVMNGKVYDSQKR